MPNTNFIFKKKVPRKFFPWILFSGNLLLWIHLFLSPTMGWPIPFDVNFKSGYGIPYPDTEFHIRIWNFISGYGIPDLDVESLRIPEKIRDSKKKSGIPRKSGIPGKYPGLREKITDSKNKSGVSGEHQETPWKYQDSGPGPKSL